MTVLVDTSVWIDHFRRGNDQLVDLLESGRVLCHPHVIGELACGNLQNRTEILELLSALPQTAIVTFSETMTFVEQHHLFGRGMGWIDIQLLASAQLSGCPLWTLDRRLAQATAEFEPGRQFPL